MRIWCGRAVDDAPETGVTVCTAILRVLQDAKQPLAARQVRSRMGIPTAYSTVGVALLRLYRRGLVKRELAERKVGANGALVTWWVE